MTGFPWAAIALNKNSNELKAAIPGDGYFPYACMLNGSTGAILDAGAKPKIRQDSQLALGEWLSLLWTGINLD